MSFKTFQLAMHSSSKYTQTCHFCKGNIHFFVNKLLFPTAMQSTNEHKSLPLPMIQRVEMNVRYQMQMLHLPFEGGVIIFWQVLFTSALSCAYE